jgi:hypothetical protein
VKLRHLRKRYRTLLAAPPLPPPFSPVSPARQSQQIIIGDAIRVCFGTYPKSLSFCSAVEEER